MRYAALLLITCGLAAGPFGWSVGGGGADAQPRASANTPSLPPESGRQPAGEKGPSEAFYREQLCWVLGGEQKTLPDRTQVDCLCESLAIEVDWATKLWEAVGQAKWYARQTGKRPAIYLVVREDRGLRWVERARELCAAEGIVLFVHDGRPTDPFGGPSPWEEGGDIVP